MKRVFQNSCASSLCRAGKPFVLLLLGTHHCPRPPSVFQISNLPRCSCCFPNPTHVKTRSENAKQQTAVPRLRSPLGDLPATGEHHPLPPARLPRSYPKPRTTKGRKKRKKKKKRSRRRRKRETPPTAAGGGRPPRRARGEQAEAPPMPLLLLLLLQAVEATAGGRREEAAARGAGRPRRWPGRRRPPRRRPC